MLLFFFYGKDSSCTYVWDDVGLGLDEQAELFFFFPFFFNFFFLLSLFFTSPFMSK